MSNRKVHFRDIRFYNNAGMNFPLCYTKAKLLDLDKSVLPISPRKIEVTCKHCLRLMPIHYPWASFNFTN